MPINFNLEEIRKSNNCSNYFETGLWNPMDDVSSKKALSCGFNKVYCLEIRQDWVEIGQKVFADDIKTGRYNLILDDSANLAKYLNDKDFKEKTVFFLDAHVDNSNIHNYKKKCPLFEELNAISSLSRKDNVILIDDLRIITTSFPWGETSYGDIDFLQQIKDKILSINNKYKFSTLDGYIKNDVLMAYV
jgi:hypothetical protein